MSFARRTEIIPLPQQSIGVRHTLQVLHYGPDDPRVQQCYIQASLHADELPGLLVTSHLVKLLDSAAQRGEVVQRICLVPYANPIGLSQNVLGSHVGRFSTSTGINFNRNWVDVSQALGDRLAAALTGEDEVLRLKKGEPGSAEERHNVQVIRAGLLSELETLRSVVCEVEMKRRLLCLAGTSDVVLDLHCDTEAVMHMYTHTRLWPAMEDLASEIQSECHLLAATSGGDPFDETVSNLWAVLQDRFPGYPIPMAAQAVTIELRGESDVSDEHALGDAQAIYRFLQRRGFVKESASAPLPPASPLSRDATDLAAVEMIESPCAGLVVWKAALGSLVKAGDVVAEIVVVDDVDAPRVPVVTRQTGIIFGRRRHKLASPGQIIVKVAGKDSLSWRKGFLLTSR
jgi:predicted deacylase